MIGKIEFGSPMPVYGLLLGYGLMEVEVWPGGANVFWEMTMLDPKILAEASEENQHQVGDWFERRILEAVARLSAHQRIAMIRDGLIIPELQHPGE